MKFWEEYPLEFWVKLGALLLGIVSVLFVALSVIAPILRVLS